MNMATSTSAIASKVATGEFAEVAAPGAATCWRCRGDRCIKKKVPADSVNQSSDGKPNVVIDVTCPICHGSGSLSRKRARATDTPRKEWDGWTNVGPEPAGSSSNIAPGPDEELCSLTGRFMIVQGKATHRYSTDDVVTAWVAWRFGKLLGQAKATLGTGSASSSSAAAGASPGPSTPLQLADIGCGIGSVLQMMAWLHPQAQLIGLEAQAARAESARRSVAYNGLNSRVAVLQGDLRDPQAIPADRRPAGGFDIVTGTPPYFDVAAGGLPPHEEAARCLFEYRGGVEAYCEAGSRLLATHGLLVLAGSALGIERGYNGAAACGLRVVCRVDVVPRVGKPPLFIVYVLCKDEAPYRTTDSGMTGAGAGSTGSVAVTSDIFGPLPVAALPYEDMRSEPYASWPERRAQQLQAQAQTPQASGQSNGVDDEDEEEEDQDARAGAAASASGAAQVWQASPGGPGQHHARGPKSFKPKQKQSARGQHVDYRGKPYSPGPASSGAGQELVYTLTVRGDGPGCPRTPEYIRLLWELGKPG